MKGYPILFLIFFHTAVPAAEIGSDFWKNCPGPACPADAPDSMVPMHRNADGASMNRDAGELSKRREDEERPRQMEKEGLKKMDAPELNERELKLEQELKAIKKEKQHREVTP